MERRIPRDKRKYLKYDSDRSGFSYFKRELKKDDGKWVHPDEFDEPAPYSKYIGSEGDKNTGEMRNNRKSYPTAKSEIWSP